MIGTISEDILLLSTLEEKTLRDINPSNTTWESSAVPFIKRHRKHEPHLATINVFWSYNYTFKLIWFFNPYIHTLFSTINKEGNSLFPLGAWNVLLFSPPLPTPAEALGVLLRLRQPCPSPFFCCTASHTPPSSLIMHPQTKVIFTWIKKNPCAFPTKITWIKGNKHKNHKWVLALTGCQLPGMRTEKRGKWSVFKEQLLSGVGTRQDKYPLEEDQSWWLDPWSLRKSSLHFWTLQMPFWWLWIPVCTGPLLDFRLPSHRYFFLSAPSTQGGSWPDSCIPGNQQPLKNSPAPTPILCVLEEDLHPGTTLPSWMLPSCTPSLVIRPDTGHLNFHPLPHKRVAELLMLPDLWEQNAC